MQGVSERAGMLRWRGKVLEERHDKRFAAVKTKRRPTRDRVSIDLSTEGHDARQGHASHDDADASVLCY
jgi:hypothetical protein